MNCLISIALTFGIIFFSASLWAESMTSKNAQLMQSLSLTIPEYQPTPLKDLISPKQMRQHYAVAWKARPDLSFIVGQNQKIKASIRIQMTVVAKTGYIVDVKFIESSNVKTLDEKIRKALLVASLEPILGLDPNVVYVLEHQLALR